MLIGLMLDSFMANFDYTKITVQSCKESIFIQDLGCLQL